MVTFGEIGGRDTLWGNEVEEISHGSGRWNEWLESIVEVDGKFYSVEWSRGLTEMQDNEFPDDDDEVAEVFPYEKVTVVKEKVYTETPPEQPTILPNFSDFEVLGLGEAASLEIEELKKVDSTALLEVLKNLEVLTTDNRFAAYAEATKRFLEEVGKASN